MVHHEPVAQGFCEGRTCFLSMFVKSIVQLIGISENLKGMFLMLS